MKKGSIILIVTISLVVLIILGWFIHSIASMTASNIEAAKLDSTRFADSAPANYQQLFKKNVVVFNETIINNLRKPISKFTCQDKFLIAVYEIDSLENLPLEQAVLESHEDEHISYNFSYSILERQSQYETWYKSGRQDKISKIYVNLFGNDFLTLAKNNDIAYYYCKCVNFSVKFVEDGKEDFFGKTEDPSIPIPLELMFYKKEKAIYMMLMIPFDANTRLEPGTLRNLIAVDPANT